jgi:MFS family permease
MNDSMSENRISIKIFLAVTFLYWISLYLYVPTLPTYLQSKTPTLSTVGFVLSMYGLWMALFRLPVGLFVDAAGRGKPFIILGLFLGTMGAFTMGKGNTIVMLAFGRALTGLAAATWVPLIVVFSTFFRPEQTVFASSLLTFSASLGRMMATGSNGFLNNAGGYPLAFFTAGGIGVLAISFITAFVKEEIRQPKRLSLSSLTVIIKKRDVLLPSVISAVVHYGDWAVTFGFLPILAQQMGAGDVMKSLLISLNIAAITAGNLLNTFMVRKVNHFFLLSFGAFLLFSGILILAVAPSLAFLFGGTLCMGFAFGIVYPILIGMSIQNVSSPQRTTAMGIHQSFYAVGMFTGPWLSGIIADALGIRSTFFITAGFYVVIVYILIYFLYRKSE